jgi:hypothetical protein
MSEYDSARSEIDEGISFITPQDHNTGGVHHFHHGKKRKRNSSQEFQLLDLGDDFATSEDDSTSSSRNSVAPNVQTSPEDDHPSDRSLLDKSFLEVIMLLKNQIRRGIVPEKGRDGKEDILNTITVLQNKYHRPTSGKRSLNRHPRNTSQIEALLRRPHKPGDGLISEEDTSVASGGKRSHPNHSYTQPVVQTLG